MPIERCPSAFEKIRELAPFPCDIHDPKRPSESELKWESFCYSSMEVLATNLKRIIQMEIGPLIGVLWHEAWKGADGALRAA